MTENSAFTIWFTGMSGSGKSTLALGIVNELKHRGLKYELLDSSEIRKVTNRSMGFTRDEIENNTLRLGYECKLLNKNNVIAVVVAVSPYRDVRDKVRDQIENFVEIYCRCSMDELMKRDNTGLFEKAQNNEIKHVAGINAPYEEPLKPEVLINTDQVSIEDGVKNVIKTLELLGKISRVENAHYTPEEEDIIQQRLSDLGYL